MSKLEAYKREQTKFWDDTRAKWRAEAKKSFKPKHRSLVAVAVDRTIRKKDRKRFAEFLETTGAGDHPDFIRLVVRLGQALEAEAAKK